MKLPRRQFLHLAAGAAALPALPQIARAQHRGLADERPALFNCAAAFLDETGELIFWSPVFPMIRRFAWDHLNDETFAKS